MNDQKNDAVEVVVNQMDETKEPIQTVAETGVVQQRTSRRSSSITFLAILAAVLAVTFVILYLASNRQYVTSAKGDVFERQMLPPLPKWNLKGTNPIEFQARLDEIIAYLNSKSYPDDLFENSHFDILMHWIPRDTWNEERLDGQAMHDAWDKAVTSGTYDESELGTDGSGKPFTFPEFVACQKKYELVADRFQWTYEGNSVDFKYNLDAEEWLKQLNPVMLSNYMVLGQHYQNSVPRHKWGNPEVTNSDIQPMTIGGLCECTTSPSDPVERGESMELLIKYLYIEYLLTWVECTDPMKMTESDFKNTFDGPLDNEMDIFGGQTWEDWLNVVNESEEEDRRLVRVCGTASHWITAENYKRLKLQENKGRCPLCRGDNLPELFEIVKS